MKIRQLVLKDFRNISDEKISFDERITFLYGKNGAGKTNAVEAIYYFAMCKSFRTNSDSDLIMHGKENAGLFMTYSIDRDKEEKNMSVSLTKDKKQLRYEGAVIEKASEFIGRFRAVFFSPDNLSLIKGSPDERRKFVDMALSQIKPSYVYFLTAYSRVLKQRNFCLKEAKKSGKIDENLLYVYSEKLAEYACVITKQRASFAQELERYATDFYNEIAEDGNNTPEKLYIRYYSAIKGGFDDKQKIKDEYIRLLSSNVEREINAGATLYGPHRDDLIFSIGKTVDESVSEQDVAQYAAKTFASQGQQRSAVLAVKLSEGRIIKNLSGEEPVYLFDDVLSELDCDRKRKLLEQLSDKQVILTGCDLQLEKGLVSSIINVKGGTFCPINC